MIKSVIERLRASLRSAEPIPRDMCSGAIHQQMLKSGARLRLTNLVEAQDLPIGNGTISWP